MYQQVFTHQARLLKALAEPKRLELTNLLRDTTLTVSQMQAMLGLPQANISQHLMVLRRAGVVTSTKNGKQRQYQLKHPDIVKACDLIRHILISEHQGEPIAQELKLSMDELVPLKKDPVCGMRLSPKTAAYSFKVGPATHYFCGEGCLKKFKMTND